MSDDRGHLKAMRLLPFTAAARCGCCTLLLHLLGSTRRQDERPTRSTCFLATSKRTHAVTGRNPIPASFEEPRNPDLGVLGHGVAGDFPQLGNRAAGPEGIRNYDDP